MNNTRIADMIDAAVARNHRHGNIRGRFYGIDGRECIDGSLRRNRVSAKDRHLIACATARYTGFHDHIEVNDSVRTSKHMERIMSGVSMKLRNQRSSLVTFREIMFGFVAICTVFLVINYTALVLMIIGIPTGFFVGYTFFSAIDYDHIRLWWGRNRALVKARKELIDESQRAIVL